MPTAELTLPASLIEGLNAPQAEAVTHPGGPLLVVAGPGSGKTRVLTHRVAALVASGVAPQAILAVTFTNKAAREMTERIEALFACDPALSGASAQHVWTLTFHAFCLRVLRVFASDVGLPTWFSIIDPQGSRRILVDWLVSSGKTADKTTAGPLARKLASEISLLKNDGVRLADCPPEVPLETADAWQHYEDEKANLGSVDFDDLLLLARELLSRPQVRSRLQARFTHLLVDEAQDTNRVQYDIVRLLSDDINPNVTLVGDVQQSIYGWRGAKPSALSEFVDGFDARVIVLNQNYRSTPQIVEVCQALIDGATHTPLKSKTNKVLSERLFTNNASGDPVRFMVTLDPDHEAHAVVTDARSRLSSGSVAILVRTNAQTRPFEAELTRAGLAYDMVGTTRFADRQEIRDAMAYLTVGLNPKDTYALERAASVPRRGVGQGALKALCAAAAEHGMPPAEVLLTLDMDAVSPRARGPLETFASDLAAVGAAIDLGPTAAVEAILNLGVLDHYKNRPGPQGDAAERVGNLEELVNAAASFESGAVSVVGTLPTSGRATSAGFVEHMALASSSDVPQDNRIVVITAHAAKGREFDHVYVVGCEDGLYPHVLAADAEGVAEERRVLFVAASRARLSLTFSARERRLDFGKFVDATPSQFLSDLPSSVVAVWPSTADRRAARPQPREPSAKYRRHTSPHRPPSAARPTFGSRPAVPAPIPRRLPPAVPAASRPSADEFTVGLPVVHPTFGSGTVLAVEPESVTVDFSGTVRTIGLSFGVVRPASD